MSGVPVVREVAWLAVIPQLAILAGFIAVATAVRGKYDDRSLLLGAGAYLALSFVLRYTVTRHHRIGVRLMKAQRFQEALPEFELSAEFFQRHQWVDRWRAITALSAARMSYREMALCNVAFGLSQIGEGAAAKAAYEKVLVEYPHNSLANAALRMISASESTRSPAA